MRIQIAISLFILIALAAPAGGQTAPSARERFAAGDSGETPDFQRHVAPLLGRLGCNGRACHGSFQGRGGFRLSLFGYDFAMDHAALLAKSPASGAARVRVDEPEQSLVLLKPLMQVDHEGGERFALQSWEHQLLKRWIEAGAQGVSAPRELLRLEVEPAEIVFSPDRRSAQLRVVAVWAGDLREDVTPLCRFRTNDDSVVTVDADGRLESVGPGDSHVVAFYDNGVAAVGVMRPAANVAAAEKAMPPAATKIDSLVLAKLLKLGIVPSALCNDAEFLRRASIDLTGTLPTPDEVEAFLADSRHDKRRRKIDELLERPAHAAWWANKLCDFTGCNPNQQAELGQETSVQWYMWMYQRLRENTPYDELIERIVTAVGRSDGESYDDYCVQVSAYFRDSDPADYSRRATMPHYWTRRSLEKPEDKALAFAHNFLGIRLQCAQCHKHPFAPWTQNDFQEFAAFFENVEYGVAPGEQKRYRELAGRVGLEVRGEGGSPIRPDVLRHAQEGRTIPWRELYISPRSAPARLHLLRSETVELQADDDPRAVIMRWMKRQDNPWFARALVNRVWAGYFHVGIIDPPDELNPANPPSNPELLEWLTAGFIDSGYDMKWLHRQITISDAYQRSWRPNATNRADRRNFSRAVPRRIPAEIVYDSLKQAAAASGELDATRSDLSRRAIGHLSMRLAGTYAMHVFGKPERAVNCDCERVNQPTLLQAIFLLNDPLVQQRLQQSGWIDEIAQQQSSGVALERQQLVRTAWLRTLSRPPTEDESQRALQHLADAQSLPEGVRDLLWALINTKEFILN